MLTNNNLLIFFLVLSFNLFNFFSLYFSRFCLFVFWGVGRGVFVFVQYFFVCLFFSGLIIIIYFIFLAALIFFIVYLFMQNRMVNSLQHLPRLRLVPIICI